MWYNRFVLLLLKSPLHFLISGSTLALHVTGRKSGKWIEVPVNYTAGSQDPLRLLVTSQRDRTWWRNLRGGARVEILLRGRWLKGSAESIEDKDRVKQGFRTIFNRKPGLARFYGVDRIDQGAWDQDALARVSALRVIVRVEPDS